MDRKKFLSTFGIALGVVCTGGCLASCSKGGSDAPGTPNPTPPPAGVNFNVDLNNEIKNIGDSVAKNSVIVVRLNNGTSASSFTAVQQACTHQGTAINFNSSRGNFLCPNHGSQFTTEGTVLNGPATVNLKKYTISISGNTMTVSG